MHDIEMLAVIVKDHERRILKLEGPLTFIANPLIGVSSEEIKAGDAVVIIKTERGFSVKKARNEMPNNP